MPSPSPPPLHILYGSATGNSSHIATTLSSTLPPSSPFYSSVLLAPCDSAKKGAPVWDAWGRDPGRGGFRHPLIVVCSTTGNGDAPENANKFVRLVKRKPKGAERMARGLAYAVLGLGDTNYDQFCAAARAIDRGLALHGGRRAAQVASADEATGLEETVEPWVATVYAKLEAACRADRPGEEKKEPAPPAETEPAAPPRESKAGAVARVLA
ncbi:hypothetical protein TeGR_g3281, partial [Tetraparma gracilis]